MSQKPPPSVWESLSALSGMGFVLAIPIVAGAWGGSFLDDRFHTKPLLVLLGLLLGLIVGIYGAYRLFKNAFGNTSDPRD